MEPDLQSNIESLFLNNLYSNSISNQDFKIANTNNITMQFNQLYSQLSDVVNISQVNSFRILRIKST